MQLADLDAPLHPAPVFDLHIAHARVLPDPQKILSYEWLRHQIYTINWTNVALLIAVIAVSANINGQLDKQRAANETAQQQLEDLRTLSTTLRDLIVPANEAAARLNASADVARSLNETLSYALSLGFANLTGELRDLNDTLASVAAVGATQYVYPAAIAPAGSTVFNANWLVHDVPVRFWKDRGIVRLDGWIQCGGDSCSSPLVLTLPPAYCPSGLDGNPSNYRAFPTSLFVGGSMIVVQVSINGQVTLASSAGSSGNTNIGSSFLVLDGIQFTAA